MSNFTGFTRTKSNCFLFVLLVIVLGLFLTYIAITIVPFDTYKHEIFMFTSKKFQICPQEKILCLMRKIEQIVPANEYLNKFDRPTQEAVLVGSCYDEAPYLISKYRLEYMFVETRPTLTEGVFNYGEPLLNKFFPAPKGYLFKYPLDGLLKSRFYSKSIGVRFNEYYDDRILDDKIKAYGNNVFPKPREHM